MSVESAYRPVVSIRRIEMKDFDFFFHWIHGSVDPEWKRWDAPYFPLQRLTREEFKPIFAENFNCQEDRRLIEIDGQPVGFVNRYAEDPIAAGWWDIGIVIYDPAYWSKGVGAAALKEWINIVQAEVDPYVLTVSTWSGNQRMVRLAGKCGFVECARIPGVRVVAGVRYDALKLARKKDSRSDLNKKCFKEFV